jgi:hypothetical protein
MSQELSHEEMGELFMKAEQGDAQSQCDVGKWYLLQAYTGQEGIDFEPAIKWLKESAAQGHSEAREALEQLMSQAEELAKEQGMSLVDKTKKRLKDLLRESASDLKISEVNVYPGVSSEEYADAMFDALTSDDLYGKKFTELFKCFDLLDAYSMPSELAVVGAICDVGYGKHVIDPKFFYRQHPAFENIQNHIEEMQSEGKIADYFLLITQRIRIFSGELCSTTWCEKVGNHLLENRIATLDFIKGNVLQYFCLNMCVGNLMSLYPFYESFRMCGDKWLNGLEEEGISPPKYVENEAAMKVLEDLSEKCQEASIDFFEVFAGGDVWDSPGPWRLP